MSRHVVYLCDKCGDMIPDDVYVDSFTIKIEGKQEMDICTRCEGNIYSLLVVRRNGVPD